MYQSKLVTHAHRLNPNVLVGHWSVARPGATEPSLKQKRNKELEPEADDIHLSLVLYDLTHSKPRGLCFSASPSRRERL